MKRFDIELIHGFEGPVTVRLERPRGNYVFADEALNRIAELDSQNYDLCEKLVALRTENSRLRALVDRGADFINGGRFTEKFNNFVDDCCQEKDRWK